MSTPRLRRTVTVTPARREVGREAVDPLPIGRLTGERAGRVQRDEVHVGAAAQAHEPAGEQVGLFGSIVHARDARVLERDPPALDRRVLAGRVDHRRDRIAMVQRHERLAERVVGRVERDRERDRQAGAAARRCMPGTTPTVDTVR